MVRDTKGKFVKGHKGMGGRPKRSIEENYRELMLSVVTPERWLKICGKAAEQAERGDTTARKWLSDYLIGPPVERKELTGAGGGPMEIRFIDDDDTND